MKLTVSSEPVTKPHRSTLSAALSHRNSNLTNAEVNHNFELFSDTWTKLELHPADAPKLSGNGKMKCLQGDAQFVLDFKRLEAELSLPIESRNKSLRILHAIEALMQKAGESNA